MSMALDAFGVIVSMVRLMAVELSMVTGGVPVGDGPFPRESYLMGGLLCSHRTVLQALFWMRRP